MSTCNKLLSKCNLPITQYCLQHVLIKTFDLIHELWPCSHRTFSQSDQHMQSTNSHFITASPTF